MTTLELLWEHPDKMMTSNIKLDDLAIVRYKNNVEFDLMVDLLNNLHERGFYKKLRIHIGILENQEQIDQLATVNGLNALYVQILKNPCAFSALNNLEILSLPGCTLVTDLEMLANKLVNLKHLYIFYASIDDIIPFIK